MHGLNTINRLNAEAFAASIANFQKQGRYVVATGEGTHLVGIETFERADLAQARFAEVQAKNLQGTTAQLFSPIPAESADNQA